MSAFGPASRYARVGTTQLTTAAGRTVVYLRRRMAPQPEALATAGERAVVDGDRPDTVAGRLLGDPTQFWRLCDANVVFVPRELTTEPGRVLRVPLPEGVPGADDD